MSTLSTSESHFFSLSLFLSLLLPIFLSLSLSLCLSLSFFLPFFIYNRKSSIDTARAAMETGNWKCSMIARSFVVSFYIVHPHTAADASSNIDVAPFLLAFPPFIRFLGEGKRFSEIDTAFWVEASS